ncbi:hypothetical protein PV396_37995 [Streptomyces sp. ME02-8801-2C]|uniref:hypothetical protein n=1 Tax=Streptomyces sp. ME02-8801-2C TaxID=3028680 RepID=UPI0029AC973E|nr:hypothetical protein [Streptomyces sp. ME02-8801-2C]MDX3457681.1 hypothetical protein [Streptomyces sp. ME02-8801-2C]
MTRTARRVSGLEGGWSRRARSVSRACSSVSSWAAYTALAHTRGGACRLGADVREAADFITHGKRSSSSSTTP